MANKLWADDKIKSLTVLAANTVDPQARWMHEQIAKDMRDDYERALAFRNEDIGRLQGEVKTQAARIAELEAEVKRLQDEQRESVADGEQWPPQSTEIVSEYEAALRPGETQKEDGERLVQVDEDKDLHDPFNGHRIETMYSGTAFLLYGYAGDTVHLPSGYCIAKLVQP